MSQRTPAPEFKPTPPPGTDDAVLPGDIAHAVADGKDRSHTDLSPQVRAALVKLAKLLARQAAEEHISQGCRT